MEANQELASGLERVNSHLQTFTALQCLLLFQALAAHRPESNAFQQISEHLKQSSLFKNDIDNGQDENLQPETLRGLYEQTVTQLSAKQDQPSRVQANGDSTAVQQHATDDRAPGRQAAKLIPLLYEDYKRRVIEGIRAEERKYNELLKDLKTLDTTPAVEVPEVEEQEPADSTAVATEQHSRVTPKPANEKELSQEPTSSQAQISEPSIPAEEKPITPGPPRPRRHNASIDSIINHDEPKDEKFVRPSTASSSAASAPSFPADVPYANLPSQHGQPSVPAPSQANTTVRQEPRHPPELRQTSPRSMPPLPNVQSRSPTTPVILPPPPGMNMNPPPFPPTSPYSPAPENSISNAYRPSPHQYNLHGYPHHDSYGSSRYQDSYSMSGSRDSRRLSQGSHAVSRPSYQHYPPPSPSYASSTQQFGQRGGVQLPPFPVAPKSSSSGQTVQSSPSIAPPPPPIRPKNVPERLQIQDGAYAKTPVRTPSSTAQGTPLSAPSTSHLRRSGISVSPGSCTSWKIVSNAFERERTRPRSVSPISDPVSDREATPAPKKPKSASRNRRGKATKSTEQKATLTNSHGSPDRSQSVSSHPSESTLPLHATKAARKLKNEPPNTPITTSIEGDTDVTATAKPMKRGQSVKRKRGTSTSKPKVAQPAVVPVEVKPPDTIVAYRNFSRMANPVLNIISSHKHASMFADPVRESQAQGYRETVKQPQDLKSIRTAITAGTRAVSAAVEAQQVSPGSASGSANNSLITLPITDALVPPKGIVNAEQLEQEVMRMFANAVMFNSENHDVVNDTREMFKDVEQALQQWRAVDRDEDAEEIPKEDESAAGSVKRRRM